ncbi:MAG: FAD-binding oxidoreductase [Oculatellaceae cyanobacterium Prado106]|nr:FAD-binding oxidoreductase [Oculatellaceae cyanobacterium Prado106]
MKHQIVIIGCGIIGATIAYELSLVSGLEITVCDRHPPAQASTGAALGVLMGAISQKVKGKAWALRQTSLQRYETLIPEVERAIGDAIPWNRQGIVRLCFVEDGAEHKPTDWPQFIAIRQAQGWHLEQWDREQLQQRCPEVLCDRVTGAIYSPQDRQVDPTALTLALVKAAQQNGVTFHFDAAVEGVPQPGEQKTWNTIPIRSTDSATPTSLTADSVVIAAGLGTTPLTKSLAPSPTSAIDIRPVLGQALRLQLPEPLGLPDFQPMLTGEDIHIVPVANQDYWVGATVEFPDEAIAPPLEPEAIVASEAELQKVLEGAIALCPALAQGKILHTWSGLRPRPHQRPAPIIEPLTGYDNVYLATGHYRNGVLLAPATALAIKDAILQKLR